jgi:drug/metabolite transporter (DMT)-like permease
MGESLVLVSAFFWALATVLAKPMIHRIRPSAVVASHAWVAVLVGALALAVTGRLGEIASVGVRPALMLGVSASFIVGGDVFLVRSFRRLDAGQAFTVATGLFVLFTLLGGWLFIGDPITRATGAAAMAILLGVYLTRASGDRVEGGGSKAALPAVALAGLLWAVGLIGMDRAIEGVDPFAGATIGYAFPALLYLAWAARCGWFGLHRLAAPDRSRLGASAALGGLGLVGYAIGIKYASAGIAALLESTAPVFAVLLAVALFKERLTARTGAGVGFCFLGIVALVA